MTESVLKGSIGILVMGIKCITSLIQEYNLRNDSVLSLHREILLLRPCIENLKLSSLNSGIHNRLQRLILLIDEIKIWLEMFATKSTLRHFFFALIHKKEINKFYIRIQEIKMEMGFEMKVDSFYHQTKLYDQINVLMEKLNYNNDIEKIKQLLDFQKQIYEMKLDNHLMIVQNVDLKYTKLVSEYESELDEMKQVSLKMQEKIKLMDMKIQDMNEKMVMIENLNRSCKIECAQKEYIEYYCNYFDEKISLLEKNISSEIEDKINEKIPKLIQREYKYSDAWTIEENKTNFVELGNKIQKKIAKNESYTQTNKIYKRDMCVQAQPKFVSKKLSTQDDLFFSIKFKSNYELCIDAYCQTENTNLQSNLKSIEIQTDNPVNGLYVQLTRTNHQKSNFNLYNYVENN